MTSSDPPEVLNRFRGSLQLVEKIARQIHRRVGNTVEYDDLVSAGNEGLLIAARRFDPARGVPFTAFATYRIRGSIYDELRRSMPLGRSGYAQLKILSMACAVGRGQLGWNHPDSSSAVDAEADLDVQLARLAMGTALIFVQEGASVACAASDYDLEEDYAKKETIATILKELESHDAEEYQIVRRHYFQGDTFIQIAHGLGISRAWIHRLHVRALDKLTHAISSVLERPRRRRMRQHRRQ